MQRVQTNHNEADPKIEEIFLKLEHQLKARKKPCWQKVLTLHLERSLHALTIQCESLKRIESAISDVRTKLVAVTQDYTAVEMLSAKQPVLNRAQQLLTSSTSAHLLHAN